MEKLTEELTNKINQEELFHPENLELEQEVIQDDSMVQLSLFDSFNDVLSEESILKDYGAFLPSLVGNFSMTNTKLEKKLRNEWEIHDLIGNDIEKAISVSKAGTDKETVVFANFALEHDIKLPKGYEISHTQSLLMNVIGSYYDAFKATQENLDRTGIVLSIEQLVGIRDGSDVPKKVSPKTKKEILNDIRLLSSIRVTIDLTQQAEQYAKNKKDPTRNNMPVILEETLLYTKILQTGDDVFINVMEKPVLFRYAQNLRQLKVFNKELLNLTRANVYDAQGNVVDTIKTPIKNSTNASHVIRDCILEHIMMINGSKMSSKTPILVSTIFNALKRSGAMNVSNKQRVHENIVKVLDALKLKSEMDPNLVDYKINEQGRNRYHSITLHFEKNAEHKDSIK